MIWLLSFHLHLDAKAKEVFTYERVGTGFVVRLKGEMGELKVIALKSLGRLTYEGEYGKMRLKPGVYFVKRGGKVVKIIF